MTLPHSLGLLGRSGPDFRDRLYAAPSAVLEELPEFRDLRGDRGTPKYIRDQGNLGSCTANAANDVAQFVERKAGDPDQDALSRLWTYYFAREKIGTVNEDSGAFLRDAFAVIAEKGVPRETFWPYLIGNYKVKPDVVAAVASAPQHQAIEYRAVPEGNERAMQACIAEGYPFAYGFAVYQSFWEIGYDGRWAGTRGTIDGYHAVGCWGYDFRSGAFGFQNGGWIMRNSWGKGWGNEGYFYVPRAYMSVEAFDNWTIRTVTR
jgi:C1A family cysteine protease